MRALLSIVGVLVVVGIFMHDYKAHHYSVAHFLTIAVITMLLTANHKTNK